MDLALKTWFSFYQRYDVTIPTYKHYYITREQYLVFQQLLAVDYEYSDLALKTMVDLVQTCLPYRSRVDELAEYIQHFLQELLPILFSQLGYGFLDTSPNHLIYNLFEFWALYSHQSESRRKDPLFRVKNLKIQSEYSHSYCLWNNPVPDDIILPVPDDIILPKIIWPEQAAAAYYKKLYAEGSCYFDINEFEEYTYYKYYDYHGFEEKTIGVFFDQEKFGSNYKISYNSCNIWQKKLEEEKKVGRGPLGSTLEMFSDAEHRSILKSKDWSSLNIKTEPFQKVIQYLPKIILSNIKRVSIEVLNHLSNGLNIRKVEPYTFMTKKMAHVYTNLEGDDKGFQLPLLYSLVITLGGTISDYDFYEGFFGERGYGCYEVEGFRAKMPMLLDALPKIIEWRAEIAQMEEINRHITIAFLSHIHRDRDLRGYKFKGRTLASFFRHAQAFHEANISRYSFASYNTKWKEVKYQPFNSIIEDTNYSIIQLTSLRALERESIVMSHCVRSYSSKCVNDGTSIWSLRKRTNEGLEKTLTTIEVNKNRKIVQAKAKFNAKPSDLCKKIINDWAEKAELIISF